MKKRILCTVLAVVMVVALAACGTAPKDDANKVTIESPVALLDGVWSTFAEDEKFPVMGGDFEAAVNDAISPMLKTQQQLFTLQKIHLSLLIKLQQLHTL